MALVYYVGRLRTAEGKFGGETHGTLHYEYNERTATSSLWARGQLLFTGVICHHSVC